MPGFGKQGSGQGRGVCRRRRQRGAGLGRRGRWGPDLNAGRNFGRQRYQRWGAYDPGRGDVR